jgi:arsenate reductase
MAEGFLKSFDNNLEVFSAGTFPAEKVSSNAIRVMSEIGIDISGGHPEDVRKYINQPFDYVITVCDNAKELCPVFTGNVKEKLHIGFDDPADATGTEDDKLFVFIRVRDEIKEKFYEFYKSKLID